MSDLIDRNVLKVKMYQEAFESDTDMQKWDSGCWIRYKLFEKVVDSTPTVPYAPRWHRVEEELPKRGEWIEENIRPRSSQFVCSECHGKAYYPQPTRDKMWTKRCGYAYCPHCGADMRAKMEVQE